jgi:hypothetical protein
VNQSIWNTGDAFTVDKEFFFGINESFDWDVVEGHFKAGFVADLHITGGEIDARLPMNIGIDTTYNKTTNSLLIETSALLASGGSFTASGLGGSFDLGFLVDALIDIVLVPTLTVNETVSVFPSVLPFDSTSSPYFSSIPSWGSIGLAWPNLSVTKESENLVNGTVTGDGASNDFIELTADLDALALSLVGAGPVADLLRLIGPDYQDADPEITFQYLDVGITASANLLQQFVLDVVDVGGTLTFEDGSTQSFTLGDDIVIRNAATLDLDGDGIEFNVTLNPNVTLDNNLWVEFDMRGDLWLLKNDPVDLLEQHITLFSTPLGDLSIVDGTAFSVAFNSQNTGELLAA